MIDLPEPDRIGSVPLETTLAARRSRREFAAGDLDAAALGQVLWAAQGITGEDGRRSAPAAGNRGALETYAATGRGLYRYDAHRHALETVRGDDVRGDLAAAAGHQECVAAAQAVLVFGAVEERTRSKYGDRAPRYVHFEAGHAVQNVLLQAEALGLHAVPVGAFDDAAVGAICGMEGEERPLYMVPLGRPPA